MNEETMTIPEHVALCHALEESRYGGKASQCAAAMQAGLPVPDGYAFPSEARGCLLGGSGRAALATMLESLGGLVAVRSSAVGEDSATASFAGQHATVLGVRTVDQFIDALREVYASATTSAAVAYRQKLGLDLSPRMGVVVQRLIRADAAGVLFSRDPISGQDVRVIEASWGLGEAIVQGLVNPDRFRMARGGRILAREAGEKDLMIVWSASGGTEEVPVEGERVNELCLSDSVLEALDRLTTQCEAVFGGTQDLEFAVADGTVHLLQRRAITRG
jgi:pyruvate,water dikinase